MEESIITIITQVGLPIGLVIYYIFSIMPRQESRYDALIDKIMIAQKECSDKMNIALEKHNQYIDELTHVINEKLKG
jgi:hypothetical protein